jgi:hypothetical protein
MSIPTEREAVERVAQDMRRQGYTIRFDVPLRQFDPRFGPIRADVVAEKGDETVIIEVKTRRSAMDSSLDQVAGVVEALGGRFRLDVVWLGDEDAVPSPDDVYDLSARAMSLVLVDRSAALLLAWAALEGALRVCAIRHGIGYAGNSGLQLLANLYGNRIISFSLYDDLHRIGRRRNLLAHGVSIDRRKKRDQPDVDEVSVLAMAASSLSSEARPSLDEAANLLRERLTVGEIRELALARIGPTG